jgi:mono/diheme cytochrome c family protein
MKKIALLLIGGLFLVASCSKKSSPTTDASAAKVNPAGIFQNYCARCHGATGTEGKAPNLAETKYDKTQLLDIVTHGKDHMPAFEDKLSAAEIEAVVGFVASLKK